MATCTVEVVLDNFEINRYTKNICSEIMEEHDIGTKYQVLLKKTEDDKGTVTNELLTLDQVVNFIKVLGFVSEISNPPKTDF